MIASIIIPTCNRPEFLETCLRALVPLMPTDKSMELLVCDDSSDPVSRQLVAQRFRGVLWAASMRKGPGANRNFGAEKARGQWLIFLDDDCVPRPDFLAAYVRVFQTLSPEENIALPGATYPGPEKQTSLLREAAYYHGGNPLPPSCNFAIPREIFLQTGGFDVRYRTSFEDIEFFSRFAALNGVVRFVPDAAADHPCRWIPPPRSLARRWEARVISSYDFGAPTWQIALRLPKHIGLVIISRFRGYPWNGENLRAAGAFFAEFVYSLWLLPGWLRKNRASPPSSFWKARWGTKWVPKKYGL